MYYTIQIIQNIFEVSFSGLGTCDEWLNAFNEIKNIKLPYQINGIIADYSKVEISGFYMYAPVILLSLLNKKREFNKKLYLVSNNDIIPEGIKMMGFSQYVEHAGNLNAAREALKQ